MKNRTLLIVLSLILIVVFLFTSCGKPAPVTPSPDLPKDLTPDATPPTEPVTELVIEGFTFKPETLTIPVGTTVTWHNNDSVHHTVTSLENIFDGGISHDDTYSYTFKQSGTFEYFCSTHPFMKAKIIVE